MRIYVKTFTGMGETYPLDVEPAMTIEQLTQYFRIATNHRKDELYFQNTLFQHEQDDLCNHRKTLSSYGIQENATLLFRDLNMNGKSMTRLGIRFVDVAAEKGLKRCRFVQNAPRWRVAGRGLCLEGICKNTDCKAYTQQVIIPIGYERFDMITDPDETTTVCPMCKRFVEPITCGFNNCWWRMEGKKIDDNDDRRQPRKCSLDWKETDDAYHYFDQEILSSATWKQLIVETVKDRPEI